MAWIRYHRRIMTVREGFVAAGFDEVTHDFGAVVHRVNRAFGTSFGVFEHTAENEARVFAAISERNRTRFAGAMTRERALILARPTAERDELKARRSPELDAGAPLLRCGPAPTSCTGSSSAGRLWRNHAVNTAALGRHPV